MADHADRWHRIWTSSDAAIGTKPLPKTEALPESRSAKPRCSFVDAGLIRLIGRSTELIRLLEPVSKERRAGGSIKPGLQLEEETHRAKEHGTFTNDPAAHWIMHEVWINSIDCCTMTDNSRRRGSRSAVYPIKRVWNMTWFPKAHHRSLTHWRRPHFPLLVSR